MKTLVNNSFFRLLTLATKSVFLVYLAKAYGPDALGSYTMLVMFVFIISTVSGAEAQWVTVRNIYSNKNKDEFFCEVKNHLTLVLMCFVFLGIPISAISVFFDYISTDYFILYFSIVCVETLLQQIHHYLIASSQSYIANRFLFVRNGLWCILFFMISEFVSIDNENFLSYLLFLWLLFDILLLAYSYFYHFKKSGYHLDQFTSRPFFNREYFACLVKGSVFMFATTMVIITLSSVPKIYVEEYFGREYLGIFSLYLSIALAIESLVISGVISVNYPIVNKLVSGDRSEYYCFMKTFFVKVFLVSFSMCVVTYFSIPLVFDFLNMQSYLESDSLLLLLLTVSFIKMLEQPIHYHMIVSKMDRINLFLNLAFLIVLIICFFYFEGEGFYSVVYAMLIGQILSLLIKTVFFLFYKDKVLHG